MLQFAAFQKYEVLFAVKQSFEINESPENEFLKQFSNISCE
jgi:hypothetical protein